eukprot:gnl/TRDRNA2_/TRDRNA2_181398_c0_seq1.p1 gnl/TRDRNA2_/TRDRNA2_181398_c0~~gnl/TRDRNA2_/TRDRNA2_181398_c0_seq1.p1  ORF type:complete len:196 (+),score=20.38 gnl/TRDRNA2_/TRDRNA2_181398_c0_seq1:35-622(+)
MRRTVSMPRALQSVIVASALAVVARGSSMHMAKLCHSQVCRDPSHPIIDYVEAEAKCTCRPHPCWNDNGVKHECKEEAFPHLTFSHDADGNLKCECSKIAHYGAPYISEKKCPGHSCADEFPVLDWDDDKKECVCRINPCNELNGKKHECKNPAFPILRYREEQDPETGEMKTVCECSAPMAEWYSPPSPPSQEL